MKCFINDLRGNMYKILHTRILLIHILVPLAGILVFSAYYSYSPIKEQEKVMLYIQAVAMAFPLMASIVVTQLYELDLKAGGFFNLLSVPCSKTGAHMGNFISLIVLGFLADIMAIAGFGAVFRRIGFTELPFSAFMNLGFIVFGANIAVYMIQYIVCFMLGKGVSLGLGILGTLLAPLMYLGLGEALWRFLPPAYGIRLSMYYFKLKYGMLMGDTSGYALENYNKGIRTVITVTLLTVVAFVIWSYKWQNTRQDEEG